MRTIIIQIFQKPEEYCTFMQVITATHLRHHTTKTSAFYFQAFPTSKRSKAAVAYAVPYTGRYGHGWKIMYPSHSMTQTGRTTYFVRPDSMV